MIEDRRSKVARARRGARLRVLAALAALAIGALGALGGCDKPTPDACRKALLNMQHLLGTETTGDNTALEGEVRRCRGGSSKEAVECATKAATLDDLKKCEFMKVPDKSDKK